MRTAVWRLIISNFSGGIIGINNQTFWVPLGRALDCGWRWRVSERPDLKHRSEAIRPAVGEVYSVDTPRRVPFTNLP